jgi:RNA polymerase sigma factor (TIGR02999 family)
MDEPGEITTLLKRWSAGEQAALTAVTPLVYAELRQLARRALRGERHEHTLQTTALVHEAFIRLVGQDRTQWQTRAHFAAVAAQAMRRILIDEARRRLAAKRPDPNLRSDLDDELPLPQQADELVALDDALTRLAALDERQARVVELKFFAGMELDEIAEVIGVGSATVTRDWRLARGWLFQQLGGSPAGLA